MSKTTMELVQAAKEMITEITAEQANEMLAQGSSALLDVRELLEYEMGAIPNAHHISRGLLEFAIGHHPEFQDKDGAIIVYCKSGGRSALAAATLQQLGFSNVHSIIGGYDVWRDLEK